MSSVDKNGDSPVPMVPSRPAKRPESSPENALPAIPTNRPLRNRTTGYLSQVAPKVPSTRPTRRHTEEFNVGADHHDGHFDAQPAIETIKTQENKDRSSKGPEDLERDDSLQNEEVHVQNDASSSGIGESSFTPREELRDSSSIDGIEHRVETPSADNEVLKSMGSADPLSDQPVSQSKEKAQVSSSNSANNLSTSTESLADTELGGKSDSSDLNSAESKGQSPKNLAGSGQGEKLIDGGLVEDDALAEKTDQQASKDRDLGDLGGDESTIPSNEKNITSGEQHRKEGSHDLDVTQGERKEEASKPTDVPPKICSNDATFPSSPKDQPGETPKIPQRPAKRAPPKKPSSKIAAFQEMLKQQQLQDQSKSKGVEGSGQLLGDGKAKIASNLNGIFGLPSLGGGPVPVTQPAVAQGEGKDDETAVASSSTDTVKNMEPTTQRRARGPKGRKLPTRLAGVEKVEGTGSPYGIQVVKAWSISFQLSPQAELTEPTENSVVERVEGGQGSDEELVTPPALETRGPIDAESLATANLKANDNAEKIGQRVEPSSSKDNDIDATYDIVDDLLEDHELTSSTSEDENGERLAGINALGKNSSSGKEESSGPFKQDNEQGSELVN
ncbi:LAFA_0D08262g1_1 [Lachancea sp. 'fantastica']|nr:LAFA_0D08262g1_1 [Lachancea sp. 'fantastica']